MAYNFTRKEYRNGSPRSGPEQASRERAIEDAIGNLEGPDGYVPGDSIADLRNDLNAAKGTSGAPPINLVTVETEIHHGHNIGHTHDATSITSVPQHTHNVHNLPGIEDFAPLNIVQGLQATSEDYARRFRDVVDARNDDRGLGWVGGETIHAAMQLARYHTHSAADITGIANYVTQWQLAQTQGNGWTTAMTNKKLYDDLHGGSGLGHTHVEAEITDLRSYALASDHLVTRGGGFDPLTMSVYNNFVTIRDEVKGSGHQTFMTLRYLFDNVQSLWQHDSTHEGQIFDLSSQLAAAKGENYNNSIKRLSDNVTGVVLSYPNSAGTAKGTYNFNFIYDGGGVGIHQLRWAGGTTVNITTPQAYTLYDNTSTRYIIATVTSLTALPGSSVNDVTKIIPQNIADLYLAFDEILLSDAAEESSLTGTSSRTWNVGELDSSGYMALKFGNSLMNKYLAIDTTSDSFHMNGHLALTAPHTFRSYRQNGTFHEVVGPQAWMYYQGTDFAKHDSSATSGVIGEGLHRVDNKYFGYYSFDNAVSQMSEYQFVRVFVLPADFCEFAAVAPESNSPGLRVKITTESTDKFKNKVSVLVQKEDSSNQVTQVLDQVSSIAEGVTDIDVNSSVLALANFTKGDKLIVWVKAYSAQGFAVKLLDAKLTYRSIPQN